MGKMKEVQTALGIFEVMEAGWIEAGIVLLDGVFGRDLAFELFPGKGLEVYDNPDMDQIHQKYAVFSYLGEESGDRHILPIDYFSEVTKNIWE